MLKPLFYIGAILILASCGGSKVTLAEMRAQEEKTRDAVETAHEETIKLMEMKSEFSVDDRDRKLEQLAKKSEELQDDINNLEDVTSESGKSGAQGVISNLKKERKEIEKKIADLKKVEREDWTQLNQEVNQLIENLKAKINRLTENLPEEEES